jgi:hypothetical protein
VAYLTYLAAVSEDQVTALRVDPSAVADPSLVVAVSYLIASWVQVQPFGRLLGQAVDGGAEVSSELWHPLRPPRFQPPDAVRRLQLQLAAEWEKVLSELPLPEDDWYRVEIEKVLRLYRHAVARAEGVVSALAAPEDRMRAHKVCIPIRLGKKMTTGHVQ